MVIESKYTSSPNSPPGSKVAPVLVTKVIRMPNATGTSMPMRRALIDRQAPRKKGPDENSSTGNDRIQLPQFSSCRRSGASSPGPAT